MLKVEEEENESLGGTSAGIYSYGMKKGVVKLQKYNYLLNRFFKVFSIEKVEVKYSK